MKKIVILICLFILTCGCSNSKDNEIEKIMKEEDYIIVDVRTQAEYNQGHIKGAINIPYDIISKNDFDKDTVIFVYCQSGNRSETAYHTLNSLGYRVYDLGAYEQINLPKE